jgi:hypothetical protein
VLRTFIDMIYGLDEGIVRLLSTTCNVLDSQKDRQDNYSLLIRRTIVATQGCAEPRSVAPALTQARPTS